MGLPVEKDLLAITSAYMQMMALNQNLAHVKN